MVRIVADKAIPFLEDRLPDNAEVLLLPSGEITPATVKDADALLVRTRTKCDAGLLAVSKVRLIATATAGTDHIDIPWCETNGIMVESAAGCNAPGVAQYTLSSLLRSGFDPSSETLGVVGIGNVGGIVTDWARRIGIRTVVSDPFRKLAGLKDERYLPLDELLKESDAVTFHVPLTTTGPFPTFQMLKEENIGIFNPNGIIINASRGGVISEKAVLSHLSPIGNVIVDTWEGEPQISLETLSRAVIATPHIAGYSLEGKQRATRMVLEALRRYLDLDVNVEGLAPVYEPSMSITREKILDSYNPLIDTMALKKAPDSFEALRNHYNYRREPS